MKPFCLGDVWLFHCPVQGGTIGPFTTEEAALAAAAYHTINPTLNPPQELDILEATVVHL